jgi:GTP cyclohydrolase II
MSLEHQSKAHLPTRFGDFMLHIFQNGDGIDHMVLVAGNPADSCLVRIHSECATGDIMGSLRCDCRDQLEESLRKIAAEKQGVFIYLRGHEGRGIGLANKIKAYALQEQGMDTVEANLHLGFPADARDYAIAADILKYFGLKKIRLLTNNQDKMEALESGGVEVIERLPLWTKSNPHNADYIHTKQSSLGHLPPESD